jgi:hypothetical protein
MMALVSLKWLASPDIAACGDFFLMKQLRATSQTHESG